MVFCVGVGRREAGVVTGFTGQIRIPGEESWGSRMPCDGEGARSVLEVKGAVNGRNK